MLRAVIFCLLLILAIGCSARLTPDRLRPVTSRVIEEVFGGSANYDIVKNSTSVTTCRMKVKPETLENNEYSYDLRPFTLVSESQANQLRRILESPDAYEFDIAKGCIPRYGVKTRFEMPAGIVDVDFCFECGILTICRDGKSVGGGVFDPSKPLLVELVKQWFPEDAEIRSLNPQ